MPVLSSPGPRVKRDRPLTIMTRKPRLRSSSSAGRSRTGGTKEHTVSIPRAHNHSILRSHYRTTAQGQRLGERSGVALIPDQALAPRRTRPFSLPRNFVSIRARNNHVLLPSTALHVPSHVHRHITLHSQAYSRPPRIAIHCQTPGRKSGPPALYFSPLLGPPPPSHSV